MDDVRCNKCGWIGKQDELEHTAEIVEEKTEWINACPSCKTDHYLMDLKGHHE